MHYYEVWVASPQFHGRDPLTYSFNKKILPGTIVLVELRNKVAEGIIVKATTKPRFTTKPIKQILIERPLPKETLHLLNWVSSYYPAPSGIIANLFVPSGLLTKHVNAALSTTDKSNLAFSLPELTQEQRQAVDAIRAGSTQTFLLHGETASGKTRVYMEIAKQNLEASKSTIVLTPEIGLTSPLANNFVQSGFPVVVVHSNLSVKQRREAWLQILYTNKPLVVIGPRSALFSPVDNLGSVIIDEAHDGSYKQDQSPHYQASRVAGKLVSLHHAKMILGTATPTISDYYIAKSKHAPILRMTSRASTTSQTSADIKVVNAKDKTQFGRDPFLSDVLLASIEQALQKQEQSLVFLNRRGTARLILCQHCDWQALCPHCDLPLTYHGDLHIARCHTCGYSEPARFSCPNCGKADIVFRSIGTKAIEASLKKLFPGARVKRFDTDNRKEDRFEAQYEQVAQGGVDILVGTQMLIKGHDLPKLSVVGVVAADTSLYFPDFSAEEQTYQLIRQVIGRVARGHRAGTAIIQTQDPLTPSIQAAIQGDWETFYTSQLQERQTYHFPPFVHLLKLTCARATSKAAQTAAEKLVKILAELRIPAEITGPTPRFTEKTGGKFQWQVIVKAKQRGTLLRIIDALPANWSYDIDPNNLL